MSRMTRFSKLKTGIHTLFLDSSHRLTTANPLVDERSTNSVMSNTPCVFCQNWEFNWKQSPQKLLTHCSFSILVLVFFRMLALPFVLLLLRC